MAGERFAVRNSGATAVVEGVGDHGLEYMTGGVVVIIGETGRNLAAGMSGGIAYVYDPQNSLYQRLNTDLVKYTQVHSSHDQQELKTLLENHYAYTASQKAKDILDHFEITIQQFKKIIPSDYEKMIQLMTTYEKQGLTQEEAQIKAFYAKKEG